MSLVKIEKILTEIIDDLLLRKRYLGDNSHFIIHQSTRGNWLIVHLNCEKFNKLVQHTLHQPLTTCVTSSKERSSKRRNLFSYLRDRSTVTCSDENFPSKKLLWWSRGPVKHQSLFRGSTRMTSRVVDQFITIAVRISLPCLVS